MSENIKSNTLCVIPWIHVNIIPNGKVIHCCMNSDMEHIIGNLSSQSLEEIWNSDSIKAIRRQMLEGEKPKVCSKCYESEVSSGASIRLYHNKDFRLKLHEIPSITDEFGHVDKIDLRYWDFRFSNLCNFKCRTCCPEFSSTWVADARKMGWLTDQAAKKLLNVESVGDASKIDFLKTYIDQVEKIYFAGGEPLLMDEHWQILEMLDASKRYDVNITYNTNLSTLSHKNKNAIDYWKKWGRKVWLCPSIDELDERAELIRHGTVWKEVQENLRTVGSMDIRVRPNITVSAMNVFRLPEILHRLIDIGVIAKEPENWKNFSINVVESPPHFHVSILPDEIRKKIRQRLDEYIAEYQRRYNADIKYHLQHLFWHLEKPWNKDMMNRFTKFTKQLDKLRNENTVDVIPELKEIL